MAQAFGRISQTKRQKRHSRRAKSERLACVALAGSMHELTGRVSASGELHVCVALGVTKRQTRERDPCKGSG